MFREMRRSAQQLEAAEAERILKSCTTAVLALSGDDGYPYSLPINYVYHGGNVYIHCAKDGHKIDAIKRNDKLSMCVIERDEVVAEALTNHYKSVILFGTARILEDMDEKIAAARVLGARFTDDLAFVDSEIEKYLPALTVVEITPQHITGKQCRDLIGK